jgi:hypothetical protein
MLAFARPMAELHAPNLSVAMLAAQTERRTGVFTVRVEQVKTRVYVAAGWVVFVEQGTLSDTLGRVLVREGKLTSDQYEVALKRMMRGQPGSQPMRFGEALVALGFLSGEEVFEALASQVRQKTIRCLTYPEPEWSFEERAHTEGHFPSRAGRLILTAARMFEPERIRVILDLEHERYPRLMSDAASAGLVFEMNATEQGILNLVDGAKSTQDLIALAEKTSHRSEVWAVLAAVVQTGVAEFSVEPVRLPAAIRHAAPAMQEPSPIEGGGPRVPVAEPSPGGVRHVPIGVIALKKSVRAAPTKVSASVDAAAGAQVGPRTARLAGEEAFQKGRRLLDRGQAGRALAELDRALALCPEAAEFRLAREWAEFLAKENEETRSAKLSTLKRMASEAVKLDPSFAFAFFVLGRVASLEGLDRPGMRFFRQAVTLDPSLVEAERYLRVLTLRAARAASSPELTAARKPISSSQLSAPKPPSPPKTMPREKPTGIERHGPMIQEVVAEVAPPASEPSAPPERAPEKASSVQGPSAPASSPRRAFHVGPGALVIAGLVAVGLVVGQRRSRAPSAGQIAATSVPHAQPQGQPSTARPAPASEWALRAAPTSRPVDNPVAVSVPAPAPCADPAARPAPTAMPSPARDDAAISTASSVAQTSPVLLPRGSVPPMATVPPNAGSASTSSRDPSTLSAPSTTSLLGPTQGIVKTPLSRGHRLFVDGLVVGETPTPVLVSCGAHTIKVGSAGREQLIDVPCGGRVTVNP